MTGSCVNRQLDVRVCGTDLLALAVEVDERVAGRGNVLRRHALVHAVDVQVETTVGVHQQTQHRPLRTRVQVRAVVLAYLSRYGDDGELTEGRRSRSVRLCRRVYLEGVVEDRVPLQQPGGAFQAAGGGGEVEPVGGVANHPQRQ